MQAQRILGGCRFGLSKTSAPITFDAKLVPRHITQDALP